MRHQNHRRSLGVTVSHRKAMLANMVTSLVKHHRITTTLARAKEASKLADKMITLAKKGTLHARRQIIATLHSPEAAAKLITEMAPLFVNRKGGYTRIMKFKRRAGDDAQLTILEFTEMPAVKEKEVKKDDVAEKPATASKKKEAATEKAAEKKPAKKASLFGGLKKKTAK